MASLPEITMRVRIDTSVLSQTKAHEYLIRFFFGGLITAFAGIIAKEFGPVIGGLFLAFPAVFPASATLVEKHEMQKKENHGLHGTVRGMQAASIEAAGSAIGSVGLAVFALVVWKFVDGNSHWIVVLAGTLSWLTVSVLLWHLRKST
jgi:Protein of unknown function (DUF3147)